MAEKRPICLYDGLLQELQSGDSLPENPPSGSGDPLWSEVVWLSDYEGGIVDISDAARSFSTGGGASISTGTVKYGAQSLRLNQGWIFPDYTPDLAFGTNDYTIEFDVYATYGNSNKFILDFRASGGNAGALQVLFPATSPGAIQVITNAGTYTSTTLIDDSAWHHVAIVREGTTLKIYIDGVLEATGTDSQDHTSHSGNIYMGTNSYAVGAVQSPQAWFDNVRITNGSARYTTNFTPPAEAHPTGPFVSSGGSTYLKTLSMPGELAIVSGNSRWYPPANITLVDVNVSVGTAPLGSAVNIDVNKNGVSIVGGGFDIAAGANQSGAQIPSDLNLDTTDYLTVDVNQIGSATPGSDLHLQIQYTRD